VTTPDRAERWWVAFSSIPTAARPSPAYVMAAIEPSVSASTADAPPCSRPYGWVFPATGMVPTVRSAEDSVTTMPMRSMRVPA